VASLADPFLERLGHNVDVLLFNPPYVPTVSQEWRSAQVGKSLEGAWAGGTNGMQLTDELLMNVDVSASRSLPVLCANPFPAKHLLSPRGRFYLVTIKANGIENIQQRMQASGFASKVRKYVFPVDLTAHDAVAFRFVCSVAQEGNICLSYDFRGSLEKEEKN
jgi:methylase of polypeptide subunit release factors